MPIFEYRCKKCNEVFEVLVRGSQKPECPNCKSKRLEKLISGYSGFRYRSRERLHLPVPVLSFPEFRARRYLTTSTWGSPCCGGCGCA